MLWAKTRNCLLRINTIHTCAQRTHAQQRRPHDDDVYGPISNESKVGICSWDETELVVYCAPTDVRETVDPAGASTRPLTLTHLIWFNLLDHPNGNALHFSSMLRLACWHHNIYYLLVEMMDSIEMCVGAREWGVGVARESTECAWGRCHCREFLSIFPTSSVLSPLPDIPPPTLCAAWWLN